MNNRRSEIHEPKNFRAVSVLKSWLRSSSISFRVGQQLGVDLVVQALDGSWRETQVDCGESPLVEGEVVVVDGGRITGRDIQGAFDVFSAYTETLGYGPVHPVDRGPLPTKKLDYHDEFERVAFRHTELCRAPNPSPEDLKRYEPVMKKASYNFLRVASQFCRDHMLEYKDLFSYAQVWTVIYLGFYEIPDEQNWIGSNTKKLYVYLAQRFRELRTIGEKKGKNILATLDVASLSRNGGRPYDYNGDRSGWEADGERKMCAWLRSERPYDVDEDDGVDHAYVARKCQLDVRTASSRRSSASNLLGSLLDVLPHGKMVEVLTEASENDRIHPDAQKEALSRLNKHREGCTACGYLANKTSFAIKPEEVDAGDGYGDAGSMEE